MIEFNLSEKRKELVGILVAYKLGSIDIEKVFNYIKNQDKEFIERLSYTQHLGKCKYCEHWLKRIKELAGEELIRGGEDD